MYCPSVPWHRLPRRLPPSPVPNTHEEKCELPTSFWGKKAYLFLQQESKKALWHTDSPGNVLPWLGERGDPQLQPRGTAPACPLRSAGSSLHS